MKKGFLLFIILFISALTAIAQTGKVVGKITDAETGDPLIGANVIIAGTNLGAATNLDGEYLIINVPPKTYSIIAKYIGYQDVTNANITISVNITTEVNFELASTEYQLGEVTIVAPKPLINKNTTNSVSIIGSDDMDNLPVRGVQNIISTQTGVVEQNGNLYVRGGRQDAVAYYVDGVLVNNPVFGGPQSMGIQNAIQEIQFQAGGYSAEFGGANSGIISVATKTGSEDFNFGLEIITDNFTGNVGEKFLGTYLFGYSEYVLTASGPLLPSKALRFYIAGNNVFNRSPSGFFAGVDVKNVYDPGAPRDTFDVYYPAGYLVNQANNQYQLQGNLTLDLQPFSFKLSGAYTTLEGRTGRNNPLVTDRDNQVQVYNTRDRAPLHQEQTLSASLKMTHVLSNNAFYDLIFSYFDDFYVDMDPIFQHNITAYGDSIANADVGTTLRGFGENPLMLTAFAIDFTRQVIPSDNYRKQKSNYLGGVANLFYQIGAHHEVKTGADYKYYTIRRYSLPGPMSIETLRRAIPDGDFTEQYNRLDNYGYDVFGNQYDGNGLDAAKNPVFAAFYIQDKMEFSDLVLNAGVRLDYIDTDSQEFINPNNIEFAEGNLIDPATLKDIDPYTYVSPRIGLSFPVTDKTVFHAQFGKFIQQSRLRDVYQGYNVVSDNIKGGFAIQ
ncbi:MAG: TonB-dependent receptor, partial [Melioribacteraceae bacterium]|nr:TonB-dependent receptor [Melioribacteraceae bacterium]